jgi:hypothetical protein
MLTVKRWHAQRGGSILDEKLILNESTPGMHLFVCKSTENGRQIFFWSSDLLRKGGQPLGVKHYIRVQTFFLLKYGVYAYQKTQNLT